VRWSGTPLQRSASLGATQDLTAEQERLRAELERDVHHLAGDIGERHLQRLPALQRAAAFVEASLLGASAQPVEHHRFEVNDLPCENLIVDIPGTHAPEQVVIVGAHYDSTAGSPGANDNASGVAALLALARRLAASPHPRTLRLVAFTNEEVPHLEEDAMGSLRYARRCKRRGDRIAAMFCLETMGYYSDVPGSQSYPIPVASLVPPTGSFIGFVSNLPSIGLLRRAVSSFRRHSSFPCRAAALPSWVPGVSWSDHASFWAQGYPAIMVTDTAPFRYPHYHRPTDTPDKVDFPRLARVVDGLAGVVRDTLAVR
jgi:Zn-dependent M28 family amino/carboxypeptidase